MAAMTVEDALTAIRSSSNHDDDDQTTDDQLTAKLDQVYKQLHRRLSIRVPQLFESVTAQTITSSASNSFAKPANSERVHMVERLGTGSTYFPLNSEEDLNWRNPFGLSWKELGDDVIVSPAASSVGTYRLTVLLGVVAGYTSLDLVPEGMEDVVVEECAAWVRQRHDEAFQYHLEQAQRIWDQQIQAIARRYGVHPHRGLVSVRGY